MFHKKQIFKLNILKQLLNDENACVSLVPSTRLLALPPFFLNDLKSGILYLLNCMLKKYDRSLGGIVIGYQNIKVLMDENTGIIPMGASETEINISVEFYIFQPKVGSLLEGIVNKKSSNHIGCLVHQYFNATILKPEDVDFDEWKCKDINENDKIVFRVKELDFTSLLPHIEGVAESEGDFSVESSRKDVNAVNYVKNNFLLNKKNFNEESDSEFVQNTNSKNRSKEFELSNSSVNKVLKKSEVKKVKGKKNDSVCFEEENDKKKGENSEEGREVISDLDLELKEEKSFDEKKKKKKKENGNNSAEKILQIDNIKKKTESNPPTPSEKNIELENENGASFLLPFKVKKEKKKKNSEIFNKMSAGSVPIEEENGLEENMLCSTQLEPGSESKMIISFCSPIPQGMFSQQKERKENERNEKVLDTSTAEQVNEKEKKKKHKREREEEESINVSKRIKTNEEKSSKEKTTESNLMVVEVNKHLVKRIIKDLNVSESKSCKRKKCEKSIKNNSEVNESREEKQKESNKTIELGTLNKEESTNKKKETPEKKRKTQENEENQNGENRNKEGKKKTEKKNSKKKKKSETAKVSPEGSVDSLYNKLLRDAISAISGEEDTPRKSAKKKGTETSDSGSTTSKKRKKSKSKEKTIEGEESFKNGSMYDVNYSPEKVKPDKSLFSDSEQSHGSPVKKSKLTNGVATVEKSQSQLLSNDTTKSSSNEKNEKKSKKNSQESLYEKLLKQAKKWIDI